MNLYAPFTENQIAYLHRSQYSWFNVAEGGKRGGKNVINSLCWCIELDSHPDKFHLAAGVDQSAARINILECDGFGVKNYFGNRCKIGKFEKKDCLYIDSQVGPKILFFAGGKRSGDQAYIKGYTYGTAYITEANECHADFLQEVFDRTISSNRRKIYHDLNPKGPNHEYYTELLDFHEKQQKHNSDYGYNYGHFTLLDNLSISDDKLKAVISTYDKGTVHYERDILGLRKQAKGLIYTRFANNPQRYFLKEDELPRFMEINVGLDFGGNKSAHALVASGITNGYNKLVALKSQRYFNNDRDQFPEGIASNDVDKFTVEFVGEVIKKYGWVDYLYWDNEATTLGNGVKRALELAYPQVTVRPCIKGIITDRIDLELLLMGQDRFGWTSDAQTVCDAFKDAIWDEKKSEVGEDIRLDDLTSDVDTLDSLEYTFTRNIKRFI